MPEMLNLILLDNEHDRLNLLPFTFTRPISEIRCGILSLREKWERYLLANCSYKSCDYLSEKFSTLIVPGSLVIDSTLLPNPDLVKAIIALKPGEALLNSGKVIAIYLQEITISDEVSLELPINYIQLNYSGEIAQIKNYWDIFQHNAVQIGLDFNLITRGRQSQKISDTNRISGKYPLFIEEGAVVECVTFNTQDGPVYIGKEALVMEGSLIRGPVSIGEHTMVKMGAKIYQGTTIGPHCR
jgi:acetyltransferase-like isoleucine patch superfamily enzyme